MVDKLLCLSCQYLKQETREVYMNYYWDYPSKMIGEELYYYCDKNLTYIHKLKHRCKNHYPYSQTKLKIGDKGYMKIDDIPSEGVRYDMNDLPSTVDLKALSETEVQAEKGKAGGLKVEFRDRKDRRLTQKYHKVAGAALMIAMKELKLTDTLQLQEAYYHYVLTDMRIGYPRYIPQEKCKNQDDAKT